MAILALLYSCGLRRSEIVSLDVAHYDPESGRLEIRGAKSKKDRVVFATNGAFEALNSWLDLRPEGEGPIFTPVDRGGSVAGIRRLSENSIYYLVERRAEEAGIEGKVRPHDFRRSFAAAHLENGADLSITARIMGHASPETTSRYDVRGENEIRESMRGMTLPGFDG
jgi:integrase